MQTAEGSRLKRSDQLEPSVSGQARMEAASAHKLLSSQSLAGKILQAI